MKAVIHVCLHNIPCIYSSPTSSTYPLPCFCVLVRSEYGVFPQRLRYFSWQPDASSTDNSSRPWHCQAFPVCRYSLVAKHKKVTGAWWANTSAANTDLRLDFLMVNREKPSFVSLATAWLHPGTFHRVVVIPQMQVQLLDGFGPAWEKFYRHRIGNFSLWMSQTCGFPVFVTCPSSLSRSG